MNRKVKSGFTLIELLVVIAIIALLLSIVTPALRKAKEAARGVVCRSNLRQMGVALSSYYLENDNKALISEGGEEFWFLQMASYMGDGTFTQGVDADPEKQLRATMKLLKCPAAVKPPVNDGGAWGTADNLYRYHMTNVEGSYAINRWIGGWIATDFDSETETGRDNLKKSYRNSACQKGSVPAIADAIWVDVMPLDTDPTLDEWTGDEDLATGQTATGLGRLTTNRHRMNTSMLYCDGHVDKVELEKLWAQRWHKEFKANYDVTIRPLQ